jgi:hypothetical protein
LECLIDETRPTDFEIPELTPDLTAMVRPHVPHDATFISELAKRDELEIVFIDADHRQRKPTILSFPRVLSNRDDLPVSPGNRFDRPVLTRGLRIDKRDVVLHHS